MGTPQQPRMPNKFEPISTLGDETGDVRTITLPAHFPCKCGKKHPLEDIWGEFFAEPIFIQTSNRVTNCNLNKLNTSTLAGWVFKELDKHRVVEFNDYYGCSNAARSLVMYCIKTKQQLRKNT